MCKSICLFGNFGNYSCSGFPVWRLNSLSVGRAVWNTPSRHNEATWLISGLVCVSVRRALASVSSCFSKYFLSTQWLQFDVSWPPYSCLPWLLMLASVTVWFSLVLITWSQLDSWFSTWPEFSRPTGLTRPQPSLALINGFYSNQSGHQPLGFGSCRVQFSPRTCWVLSCQLEHCYGKP